MPAQTPQVLLGASIAVIYTATVAAVGTAVIPYLLGGQHARAVVRSRFGPFGLVWLGFVTGQGILGVLWLGLSLAGVLRGWTVSVVCGLSCALYAALPSLRGTATQALAELRTLLASLRDSSSWYSWLLVGAVTLSALRGLMALMPSDVADALKAYLVMPRVIAASGSLQLQPFAHPFYALLPLQVEMHWAALFAISNETAVTVWDYICAMSVLGGVGLLARSLTGSRRVALVAALMVLSTPGFYSVMGGGKVDNAAAQFGIAAFLCCTLWPDVGRRAAALTGLFAGWAVGSRYTDIIIVPALVVYGMALSRGARTAPASQPAPSQGRRAWLADALVAGCFAAVAGVPVLVKNWLLVGCPLAPQFGCQETFWARIYAGLHGSIANISVTDLLAYPFVWTFAQRSNMLGNLSPLFLGLVPLFLLYRRGAVLGRAPIAGLAGLVAVIAWMLIEPLILHTRWLLVPLGLLAVPLSAALVAFEDDPAPHPRARGLTRGAMVALLCFVAFESRGVVHAARYVAAVDSREHVYQSESGYDVATWLNTHAQRGARVALAGYTGFSYFVDPDILLQSESASELQWLWKQGDTVADARSRTSLPATSTADLKAKLLSSSWSPAVWRFYTRNGFVLVVVPRATLPLAVTAWPGQVRDTQLRVAFLGREDAVLALDSGVP